MRAMGYALCEEDGDRSRGENTLRFQLLFRLLFLHRRILWINNKRNKEPTHWHMSTTRLQGEVREPAVSSGTLCVHSHQYINDKPTNNNAWILNIWFNPINVYLECTAARDVIHWGCIAVKAEKQTGRICTGKSLWPHIRSQLTLTHFRHSAWHILFFLMHFSNLSCIHLLVA